MPDRQQWTVDPDWLSKLIIVFLSLSAPAFLQDDAAYFSYLNNALHPHPLYYVNGFVYIIPELAAYALSVFPLALQALLYRVPPLLIAIALYREYRLLFSSEADRGTASLVALSAILITRVVEPDLWADLGFLHYACYLWATLRVVRMHLTDQPLSWTAFAAVLIAAVSFPLGVMFAPILLLQAARRPAGASRRQLQALAIVIVGVHVAFAVRAGGIPVRIERPDRLALAFVSAFRERKLHNLVAVVSMLALTIIAARSIAAIRSAGRRAESISLWFLGAASIVAYFYSDRFRQNNGGFEPQHVTPVLTCALAATGLVLLRARDGHRRATAVGAALGFAAAMAMVGLYTTLRGPLELSLMKYRFLSVAEDFRRHCRGDDAMVFEDDQRSPVVLCKPRALGVGFHPVRVPPSVGVFDPDSPDHPGIYVLKSPF